MSSENMKFIVICQHRFFSNSLCSLVQKFKQGAQVIEAENVDSALALMATSNNTSMVIFYMALEDVGWDSLRSLRAEMPSVPLMVVADFNANEQIRKAIYIGADGCVSTDFTWRTVTSVITRVLNGEIVSPPISYQVGQNELPEPVILPPPVPMPFSFEPSAEPAGLIDIRLTPRQEDVLRLIQEGDSNKQIAKQLSMALSTVKIHCAAIFKELGVANRTQAAIGAGDYFKNP